MKKFFKITFKDEIHRGATLVKLFGWKSMDEICNSKTWKVAKKESKSRNGKKNSMKKIIERKEAKDLNTILAVDFYFSLFQWGVPQKDTETENQEQ